MVGMYTIAMKQAHRCSSRGTPTRGHREVVERVCEVEADACTITMKRAPQVLVLWLSDTRAAQGSGGGGAQIRWWRVQYGRYVNDSHETST
jgi:hypothetical protein